MSDEKPRIMLVEDELHLARGICFNLEQDGYAVSHFDRGCPAWMVFRSARRCGSLIRGCRS